MLWLALVLPALPLQLAGRALEHLIPLAVFEGPSQRPLIVACNALAHDAGIEPGMKLAAAQALARNLVTVQRQPENENAALQELACWAYQFSAQIALPFAGSEMGLLIETGASAQLFGGQEKLHRSIAEELTELGYRGVFAYAVTPRAAWLLATAKARGHKVQDATSLQTLMPALAPLPLSTLDWDASTLETLRTLGLANIASVLRLPRDAFAKRFGTALIEDLDRATGRLPDPLSCFEPPTRFHAAIELPADFTDTAQLMFPAHRLLRSLEGFLRGRDAGATELMFKAGHSARRSEAQAATQIELKLAVPERNADRLAKLFAERLARIELPAAAVSLSLTVERLLSFEAINGSLLPQPGGTGVEWLKLAETLHARLGSERVFQLQTVDDHRPEYAYRVTPLSIDGKDASASASTSSARPLLLLPKPALLPEHDERPSYRGPLQIVAGPERIESGWWELGTPSRKSVHRDYFVARNPRGQVLWVFRELAAPHSWFLHGFFA